MIDFILYLILAYLVGSVSFGHIVARMKKIDIAKVGSGSPTATNVSRALGWRWGSIAAILDFAKGAIPTALSFHFLDSSSQIALVAISPIIGHIFPVFFKFRGGRGGATFLGSCLGLMGFKVFLPAFLGWIFILILTKITSLTNLIFPWIFAIFLYFYHPPYLIFGIGSALLISFALRNNIKRLIRGEELKTPLKI